MHGGVGGGGREANPYPDSKHVLRVTQNIQTVRAIRPNAYCFIAAGQEKPRPCDIPEAFSS